MTNAECQISNAEVKKAFLSLIRGNSFNQEELKVFLRNVYSRIERDYPEDTQWAYNYFSRKYTTKLSKQIKAQRVKDSKSVENIYKGVY